MKSDRKTKNELIDELKSVRRKVKKLETLLEKRKHTQQGITDRKKAEETLRESEELYHSFYDNSPISIELYDAEGALTHVNRSCQDLFGIGDVQDIWGLSLFANPNLSDKHKVKLSRGETIHYQGIYDFEKIKTSKLYSTNRSGIIWLDVLIKPLRNSTELITGFLVQIQDITERKRAEEALRASEEGYRHLFDASPDGIVVIGSDGRIISANIAQAQMYRYDSPNDLIGVHATELVAISSRDYSAQILQRRLNGEDIPPVEYELVRKDGTTFFGETSATTLRRADGMVSGYICTTRDTTERKRIEEKLIEDESRLSALFDNAGYSISLAKNGVLILGNPAFVKLFGYKDTSEFLGKSFINTIAPEERERIRKYAADREMSGEVPNYYETKGFRRDGSIFDMNVRISRYIFNNEIYIVGFQSDITERKRVEVSLQNSEAALREAQRVARIGSWHWDAKSDAIWWSDELYRIYEKDPGIPPSTFEKDQKNYTPESAAQLTAAVQKALKTGEPYEIDLELVHNTEPRRWVIARGEVIRNASSQITGLRGTAQDITERKRVEEELHESEEKYRYMFANNPQPMWIYDLETLKFLEINSAALEHYGYSREEFLSMTLKDIRPKEDIDALLKDVELTTKGYNPAGEWRHLKKSGEIINVEIISHIVTFKDRKARHVMVNDITERKQAEQEISKSHNEFRMLANHLQNIREEERTRMAREFHDQLGQSMTALKMDLSLLLRMISDEKQEVQRNLLADELRSMQKLVDETINMIWVIIAGLRPQMLEDLGLVTTLEWEAKQFESRTGISCEFKSSAGDIQMDSNKAIALFRIYQEALTNVACHANATVVKSVLKRDHEMLVLEIKDNGCGISRDKKSKPESFGLIGMRERAIAFGGSVEISGIAGEGTTVIVRLPLEQVDAQESISK